MSSDATSRRPPVDYTKLTVVISETHEPKPGQTYVVFPKALEKWKTDTEDEGTLWLNFHSGGEYPSELWIGHNDYREEHNLVIGLNYQTILKLQDALEILRQQYPGEDRFIQTAE